MGDSAGKAFVAKSAALVSVISGVSLIFSFLKETAFAYWFGTSPAADAYTVAIQIPVTLFAVVSTAIQTVVIPNYSKLLYSKSQEDADRFASRFATLVLLVTVALVVLGELAASYVVLLFAPGLDAETLDLATRLFRIALPTVIASELTYINMGILNVHNNFVLPSLATILMNIAHIAFILTLSVSWGIEAAIYGLVVGTVLQFSYCAFLRRRHARLRWSLSLRDEGVVRSLKMAAPVFLGIGAAEINKVVDRVVASFLASGSIASLNYASRLSSAISSLLISGITTVLYPEFAKAASKNQHEKLVGIFSASLSIVSIILVPIIVGICILDEELVAVVFYRGSFSMDDVIVTAPLFACYAACLLFTAYRQIGSRLYYSIGDSKTPMKNSLVGIALNIILNIALGLTLGAFGLALATTISTAVISALIFRCVNRDLEKVDYGKFGKSIVKSLAASVVMGLVVAVIRWTFVQSGLYSLDSLPMTVLLVVVCLLTGALVYLIVMVLLKAEELHKAFDILRSRCG